MKYISFKELLSKKSYSKFFEHLNYMSPIILYALSISVFIIGFLLLCILFFPNQYDTKLPDTLGISIRIASFGIATSLLLLSKGIWDRVLSAYYLTLTLLIITSIIIFLTSSKIVFGCILLFISLVLFKAKPLFYRPRTRFNLKFILKSYLPVVLLSIFYFYLYERFTKQSFITFESRTTFLTGLNVFFILLFICLVSILLVVLSTENITFESTSKEELEKLESFLTKYKGNSMTHLIFLKDKQLFFAQDEQVLIAFRAFKDTLIVLGDPIGDSTLFKAAINDFREYANYYKMTPLFYEVSEEYLSIYHENGFKFLKLGEEAILDLSSFTLTGKKFAQFRTIKNKINRGEFSFELLTSPLPIHIMLTLEEISTAWLGGRREKEFSLGSFNEEYINRAPVAIIKHNDRIIGFSTILPMYDSDSISIDLMRLLPNAPNGTMDALFLGIIEWAISQNYKYFVLGKAPLSNVGYTQFSTKKEKIVKYIYQYGNKLYSFNGLRRYKEKYHPLWKGIYLAYPSSLNLSISLIHLTRMISGSEDFDK